MSDQQRPFDVSKELASLRHEKKNNTMKKLPTTTTIQRRPLHHAPVASPLAGAHVQKVVYVSRKTPVMSAVKRVKKLLQHIEKRATQGVNMKQPNHAKVVAELSEVSDKLAKSPEEILVKASGRAMEQALRVGEWFRAKEDELLCKVEVRTSSVAAIDDIVEIEKDSEDEEEKAAPVNTETQPEESTLEGGETTLEILGHRDSEMTVSSSVTQGDQNQHQTENNVGVEKEKQKRRRKRKRATYDEKDTPEARIRWVKTVEIAISLKS